MFRLSNLIKSVTEGKKERSLNGSIAIWNFTNRCNLACHHCYSYADPNSEDFLTTEFILGAIAELKRAGIRFVIFSGGEPLIRRDIFQIAEAMREQGIVTYLSTNGLYVTEKNVDRIIGTFNYIGISIDGIEEVHDRFRGLEGAYRKSLDAIDLIQKHGGNAGIRFTITDETKENLYDIFDLAENIGVDKIYISHLVYSGRGLDNLKIDISKEERRKFVEFIIDKAFAYHEEGRDIDVVTGNMEMDAILFLEKFSQKYPQMRDEMLRRLRNWGGNSAGRKLVNIDWMGHVKPDPFFPVTIGNITERPFDEIWLDKENELLTKLREHPRKLSGKCADCGVIDICNGGSRSRAWAIHGDLWAEDPSCYLTESERSEKLKTKN
ncbi:radical SAM/SPASM domain-containing protein [Hydrogenimonas urashimensis]|uniref:radical SAM/SPASM domain-containing protein n=1 Tax=Hydrogenimonas urashimensis TaxID=2740515 RepID=UPI0019163107|nr:radical SAM protein [Hydrogenimonas urashimensis]